MPSYYRDTIPFRMSYLGGSTAACGTTSTQVTIAAGAHFALIHAEGGAIYWGINIGSATTLSPGYAAEDLTGIIPSIDNLGTLFVIGAGTAAIAHVEFYQS